VHQWRAFVTAVHTGDFGALATFADGARAVVITDQIARAAASGRRLPLDLPDQPDPLPSEDRA
jgi:hypothetical protein